MPVSGSCNVTLLSTKLEHTRKHKFTWIHPTRTADHIPTKAMRKIKYIHEDI